MFIDPALRNQFLKNLTHDDFLALGEGQVVYVRPVTLLGATHYAVHDASGEQIVMAPSLARATHLAAEKDLEVITVH